MSPELSPRFTDRARKTMKEAAQVARERRHLAIEPGHVLVALCREGGGVGANMLRNFQVDLTLVSERVLGHPGFVMGEESELLVQDIPTGMYTKAVISAAVAAAQRLGHDYVGTEHILIALTEVSSVAQEALLSVGVTTTKAEEALRQLVGDAVTPREEELEHPSLADVMSGGVGDPIVDKFQIYVSNAERDTSPSLVRSEARAQVWATLALATALNKIAESVKRICDVAELEANDVSQEKGKPEE
jgi:ATP-dependent Clp protease ATP-binding subunit ClpC